MAWDCLATFADSNPLVLPCAFTSRVLAVDISAGNYRPTWYRSGYLEIFVELDGEPFTVKRQVMNFGQQLLEVPVTNYKIRFQPQYWLESTVFKVRQLTTTQIQEIMPLYSTLPTTMADQPVLDSIPTSFTAPVYNTATAAIAYQCLAANTSRQSYAITNIGTAAVFIDLDPPTALNKRMVAIAPNGVYVSDIPYVGAVFAWSSTAATMAIEVREFIQ
jgi:hypothetical protein